MSFQIKRPSELTAAELSHCRARAEAARAAALAAACTALRRRLGQLFVVPGRLQPLA